MCIFGGASSTPQPAAPDPQIAENARLQREKEAEEAQRKQRQIDARAQGRRSANSLITGTTGIEEARQFNPGSLF